MADDTLSELERGKLKKKEQRHFLKAVGFDFSHGWLERDVNAMAAQYPDIAAKYKNIFIPC